jgi:hypothetical protein
MAVPVAPAYFAADPPDEIAPLLNGQSEETLKPNKLDVAAGGLKSERGSLTLLQKLAKDFLASAGRADLAAEIPDNTVLFPKSLERLGDDVLVVPAKAFLGDAFGAEFWAAVADKHRAKRVARRVSPPCATHVRPSACRNSSSAFSFLRASRNSSSAFFF